MGNEVIAGHIIAVGTSRAAQAAVHGQRGQAIVCTGLIDEGKDFVFQRALIGEAAPAKVNRGCGLGPLGRVGQCGRIGRNRCICGRAGKRGSTRDGR